MVQIPYCKQSHQTQKNSLVEQNSKLPALKHTPRDQQKWLFALTIKHVTAHKAPKVYHYILPMDSLFYRSAGWRLTPPQLQLMINTCLGFLLQTSHSTTSKNISDGNTCSALEIGIPEPCVDEITTRAWCEYISWANLFDQMLSLLLGFVTKHRRCNSVLLCNFHVSSVKHDGMWWEEGIEQWIESQLPKGSFVRFVSKGTWLIFGEQIAILHNNGK